MKLNFKLLVSLLIGIVFSGAALYFAFRNVPLASLLDYIKTINIWWIILSVAVGFLNYFLKVIRWQIILSPVKKLRFRDAYHPFIIGFMINVILPGRIGELTRPAILYKRDKISFSKGVATIGIERIFDLFALLFLFIVIISSVSIDPNLKLEFNGYQIDRDTLQTIWTGMLKAGIALMVFIVLLMLPFTRTSLSRIISWMPELLFFTTARFREDLTQSLKGKSQTIFDNIAHGFEVLKDPFKIFACLMLSLGAWLLVFLSFYLLSMGCRGLEISFFQAAAVTIFICFFIILPSVPGYWGIWEIGGIYGLMLFGVSKVTAAGVTLAFHAFQILPLIPVGLLSAWITGINVLQTDRIILEKDVVE